MKIYSFQHQIVKVISQERGGKSKLIGSSLATRLPAFRRNAIPFNFNFQECAMKMDVPSQTADTLQMLNDKVDWNNMPGTTRVKSKQLKGHSGPVSVTFFTWTRNIKKNRKNDEAY